MSSAAAETPEPRRIRQFLVFFRGYMGLSALVTACLPVPVTASKLIPTYAVHTPVLTVYTSLFCFLLLAYVFSVRHFLARWMFRDTGSLKRVMALVPAVLIVLSAGCAYAYQRLLESSLAVYIARAVDLPSRELLAKADWMDIPHSHQLMALYILTFLLAESAFVLMAIREYLQDVLGIDDRRLLRR